MGRGRDVAVRVLGRVEEGGAYADRALETEADHAGLDARDRALAGRLVAGTVQRRRTIDHVILTLGGRDPATLDPVVRDALRLGTYQLVFADRIPDHAAVSTSVELVRRGGRTSAKGLVNAILRKVAAEGRTLVEHLPDTTPQAAALRRSYPDWIASLWWDAYGARAARGLMDAGNQAPEVALRVNALRHDARERIEFDLAGADVPFHDDPAVPSAIVLDGPFHVGASRLFTSGDGVPMSRASQRIVPLLGLEPGMRVLDACAAPGGKSGQIAASLGGAGDLVCVERDAKRAAALRIALERQGAGEATVLCADATTLDPAIGTFDAILIDAPCSGLGVLAGRPDLRWRRTPQDVVTLAAIQRALVGALLPRLRPGGTLVYAVCTLAPAENEAIVAGLAVERELRTHPEQGEGDGFYAAVVRG
jgi:16S rRNA (cytosine967-C5)-methyltransferase